MTVSPTSVRRLITLNALVGMVAGIGLLVLPAVFLSIFGLQGDAVGIVFARLYGAELVGFNVATWLIRDAAPPSMPIVRGHIVNEGLTAVVAAAGGFSGLGNLLVWGLAALAAFFALGYAAVAWQGPGGAAVEG